MEAGSWSMVVSNGRWWLEYGCVQWTLVAGVWLCQMVPGSWCKVLSNGNW
jgi:hypothetical protein